MDVIQLCVLFFLSHIFFSYLVTYWNFLPIIVVFISWWAWRVVVFSQRPWSSGSLLLLSFLMLTLFILRTSAWTLLSSFVLLRENSFVRAMFIILSLKVCAYCFLGVAGAACFCCWCSWRRELFEGIWNDRWEILQTKHQLGLVRGISYEVEK